ncbi:MAG TPA: hypothetical protein VKE88_01965, partial [Candidatus Nanoarchaeia archaeon]|nr:hypothetical protein [Candidatus Nanoarchaeia archaeon]
MVQKETLKVTVLSKEGKVEKVVTSQVGGSSTQNEGTGGRSGNFGSSTIYDSSKRNISPEQSRQESQAAVQQYEQEQQRARTLYEQVEKVKVSGSNLNEAYSNASKRGLRVAEQVGDEIYFSRGGGKPELIAQVVGERRARAQFPSGE